ncbi:alpha/beta hydrolase [Nocardioides marmoribigeumensis]|uniref:Acyl-CoA:diacylglycerol acyltransferase n=1 Tax=Nocardioides marmoribigeumensis TaxID=433649 RepID=A0ABU2BRC7_9ACTN|nr:esterase [Nocardioides marmoribigeumensis]MDR7361179.1 enterochelin esterase-like enzyme [Nocardioides marmoribigeumensis]
MSGLSRRALLRAGGGVVGLAAAGLVLGELVEEDRLPGRARLHELIGNGEGTPFPEGPRGELVSGSFDSAARRGTATGWTVAYPHGTPTDAALPVLVVLHGRGGDHTTAFTDLGLDRYASAAVAGGARPFAIATVDGGTGYWRPEPSGADAGRMVADELLPLLARRGLDVERPALAGWSMGGYGVLRLAGLDLVPATSVATLSPAVHRDEPTSADDVLGHPERLVGVPVQVNVGAGDPYRPVDDDLVEGLRRAGVDVELHGGPGAHEARYWRTYVPGLLDFTLRHLAG